MKLLILLSTLLLSQISFAQSAIECTASAGLYGHSIYNDQANKKWLRVKSQTAKTSSFCASDKDAVTEAVKMQMRTEGEKYISTAGTFSLVECNILSEAFIEAMYGRSADIDVLFGYNGPRYDVYASACLPGITDTTSCKEDFEAWCESQPKKADFYLLNVYHHNYSSFTPEVPWAADVRIEGFSMTCEDVGEPNACAPLEEKVVEKPHKCQASGGLSLSAVPFENGMFQSADLEEIVISKEDCIQALKDGSAKPYTYNEDTDKYEPYVARGSIAKALAQPIQLEAKDGNYQEFIHSRITQVIINGITYTRSLSYFSSNKETWVSEKTVEAKQLGDSVTGLAAKNSNGKAISDHFRD